MSGNRGQRPEDGGQRSEARGQGPEAGGLDLAIDRAVREMLDIEPPANLRANVIARIEKSSPFPVSSFQFPVSRWVRVGVVTAAAAALVLAVVLARRSEPIGQSPTRSQASVSQASVAQATDIRLPVPVGSSRQMHPAAPQAPTAAVSQQTRRAPASIAAAASIAGADDTTTSIEPLKTITPIELTPINQSNIAPDPIAVRPLTPIAEVQIAPLNPPDRRN